MSRQTFVIQVYTEGRSTLENLSTQERVPVPDLAAVGGQIERWLAASETRNERVLADRAEPDRGNGTSS